MIEYGAIQFVDPTPDPYLKVAALAERLGVLPYAGGAGTGAVIINLRDGRSYDLMDLIGALLDRLDGAVPK